MTITLRQESATGATTKGSSLTFAELDNNFKHLLRQGTVAVAGDSGAQQTLGEADKDSTLIIAGGANISSAVSAPDSAGATTLTITNDMAAGLANIVEDTSPQLGGDLDVNGQDIVSTSNANIDIVPNGTGDVTLQADTVQIGDNNANATLTTQGTGDLTLNTNSGTNSGAIVIADAANGNISITPNGTGQTQTTNLRYDEDIHDLGTTGGTITPDVANGNVQTITLNNNLTFSAFSNPIAGQSLTLIIDTDGTGRTLTSTMKFAGGTKTMSTTDTFDIMTVFYDGTRYYANYVTNYS